MLLPSIIATEPVISDEQLNQLNIGFSNVARAGFLVSESNKTMGSIKSTIDRIKEQTDVLRLAKIEAMKRNIRLVLGIPIAIGLCYDLWKSRDGQGWQRIKEICSQIKDGNFEQAKTFSKEIIEQISQKDVISVVAVFAGLYITFSLAPNYCAEPICDMLGSF